MPLGENTLPLEAHAVLDALEAELQRQLTLAQAGNIDALLEHLEIARPMIEQAVRFQLLPAHPEHHQRIKDLYAKICLTVADAQAQTGEKLLQLHRGKKTLRVYKQQ